MSKSLVEITKISFSSQIALKGDIAGLKGLALPEPLTLAVMTGGALVWMAPDEVLALADAPPNDTLAVMQKAAGKAFISLNDMSDARVFWQVTGAKAAEVFAKLTPADVAAMPVGGARRTRLGQVAVLIIRRTADQWQVGGFRSYADYIDAQLHRAATPGSDVFMTA